MPENIINALSTLEEIGYSPSIPVTKQQFANPDIRNQWVETKHMEVLALISNQHPDTTLDIFVTEPFNFDNEYKNSDMVQLDQNLEVRIVSIQTLIEMKANVGRDRDKDDIKHLTWILDSINEEK